LQVGGLLCSNIAGGSSGPESAAHGYIKYVIVLLYVYEIESS
jgi:hypothetical protein